VLVADREREFDQEHAPSSAAVAIGELHGSSE
jgi:hypothetical protein